MSFDLELAPHQRAVAVRPDQERDLALEAAVDDPFHLGHAVAPRLLAELIHLTQDRVLSAGIEVPQAMVPLDSHLVLLERLEERVFDRALGKHEHVREGTPEVGDAQLELPLPPVVDRDSLDRVALSDQPVGHAQIAQDRERGRV